MYALCPNINANPTCWLNLKVFYYLLISLQAINFGPQGYMTKPSKSLVVQLALINWVPTGSLQVVLRLGPDSKEPCCPLSILCNKRITTNIKNYSKLELQLMFGLSEMNRRLC